MKGKNLMKAKYTYDELAKAYGNFLTPALAIYINGGTDNIIKTKGMGVESAEVTLSVEGAATLHIRVTDVFDAESTSIKKEVRDSFQVGTVIEAAMGYGSDLTSVFQGYVTEYQTSYQELPSVSVTAVDFRKLLMENKKENLTFPKKTCAMVFQEILSNYKGLYKELHIDEEDTELTLVQNGTDYEFIQEELGRVANREFFVVGSDVYFIEPEEEGTAYLRLDWQENLVSFQKAKNYCHETIRVHSGQEDKTGSVVSGRVLTDANTPSLTKQELVQNYVVGPGKDNDTLNNCRDKIIADKKKKNITAQGSLTGLPEIVPGRYLEVGGVDQGDTGVFYISEVNHSFSSNGFATTFTAGKKKERLTSSRGTSEKKNSLMRAVVKKNWDENNPGRLSVEFLTGEEGKKTVEWLPVLHPYCGGGYGFYFLPEVDTEVVVARLSGDNNAMVVLGSLWNGVDVPPDGSMVEKNTIKRIRTKGNHEILFDDKEDSSKIQIITNKKLKVELNDKEQTISLSDEKKDNSVTIDTGKGTIDLAAKETITLSAGGKQAVVISGGDKITLQSGQIVEKGTQSHQIQTQKLEIGGNSVEIKGSTSMKLNSSGMTEVKGSIVKIN